MACPQRFLAGQRAFMPVLRVRPPFPVHLSPLTVRPERRAEVEGHSRRTLRPRPYGAALRANGLGKVRAHIQPSAPSSRSEVEGHLRRTLRLRPYGPTLRANGKGADKGAEGERRGTGGHWAMKKTRPCGRVLHGYRRDCCLFAQSVFPVYCTVRVTSSSVKSVLPEDEVSLPVNLITTVWPMYGARLAVCTV
jgi:hypothetical protein